MGALAERVAALGRTPFDGEAAGADVRYEPEFEALSNEIAKLGSITGEQVDWAQVVEFATGILESRSKDVAAATYLCSGLFELEGYGGLAAGITLLADLHETFGEKLFPSRPRGRANALTWLAERLEGALERRAAGGGDQEAVTTTLEQLRRLDGIAAEQYGDNAPALGPARRALEGMVRSLEAEEKRKEAPRPAAAVAAGGPPSSMSSPEEVLKALATAAPLFRAADATDPLAHLLPRLAAWGGLAQVPPNEGGKTRVPGPERATRQALTGLLEQGDWPGLVAACEERLPLEPLWLDPQRWAVQGLRHLGDGYAAAAAAVVAAVRVVLTRLPGFHLLTFADGTPYADGETRLWIDTEVLATGGAPAAAGGEGGGAAPWEEAEQEARAKAAGGDLKGGLALLQEGGRSAASGRDRFHWRLAAARLCHTAGRADLAVSLLDALDEEAQTRDLAAWSPELARTVLATLVEARQGSGGRRPTPEDALRLQELQARLCRLDVVAALDLEGGVVRGR